MRKEPGFEAMVSVTDPVGFNGLHPTVLLLYCGCSQKVCTVVSSDVKPKLIKLVQLQKEKGDSSVTT